MLRAASLLVRVYKSQGHRVSLIHPPAFFGAFPFLPATVRKYLAYIDKFFLLSTWLFFVGRLYDRCHIADHSNSFYSFFIPTGSSVVTCHDLLAIRGALGDPSASCDASPIGVWLQRLIQAGLRHTSFVSFVSLATYSDFQSLIDYPPSQHQAVHRSPLNDRFAPVDDPSLLPSILHHDLSVRPYLLMVGSALPRKNRALSLQVLEHLSSRNLILVFAGEPLTADEQMFRDRHPLGSQLVSLPSPTHLELTVLYSFAHALLFPSFSEGFGWPLIEAQACGCPVIASTTTSIPEIAGEGALYAAPTDAPSFADHALSLFNPHTRSELIEKGFSNSNKYAFGPYASALCAFVFES